MIHRALTARTNRTGRTSHAPPRASGRATGCRWRARSAVATAALVVALSGAMVPGAATAQEESLFAIDDRVVVTADEGLNLREEPGTSAELVETLLMETEATVIGLPEDGSVDDFDWFQIETDDGVTGWAVGDYLELIESDEADASEDADGFSIGSTVIVATDELNLRDEAGVDTEIIETLAPETELVIDSEPVDVDDLTWYRVSVENREMFGWVAADFLTFVADPPVIEIGNQVMVNTDTLTIRDDAGLDAEAIDALSFGFAATVIDGPVDADGFTWYQIESDDVTGWVAGAWLAVE